ncbi:hypothetical protein TWF694_001352 [Orbilia ellipsospora]|uniref:Uncharacterized protein n=1 Tax=Orbilia ellipsospora TaxID=2528407 RepID=A0AAV9XTW7_9PEZI
MISAMAGGKDAPVLPPPPGSHDPQLTNEDGTPIANAWYKTNEGPIFVHGPAPHPPPQHKKLKKEKKKTERSNNYGSRSEVCGDFCTCCDSITGCFRGCFEKGRMSRSCDCQGDCDFCFCCFC